MCLNFLFSSVPISSTNFPDSVRWLFAVSATFWGLSGPVMDMLDDDNYSNEGSCFDFITCLLSDGSFIAYKLGFAPMSNQFRALSVLTGCFLVLLVLEYFTLRHACNSLSSCGSDFYLRRQMNHKVCSNSRI